MSQTRGKRTPFRRKRIKGPYVKLSRDYVEKAVGEYLKKGGKITIIEDMENKCGNFLPLPDIYPEADDFLLNK